MIKECLNALLVNDALVEFRPKVKTLYDSFDEHQLEYILNRTVTIDTYSNIYLQFNSGIGFRCTNNNQQNVGKLPICNQIEKILNEKYLEFITKK